MALAFAPYGKTLTVRRIDLDDKTRRHLNNLGLAVGAAVNRALAMRITVA